MSIYNDSDVPGGEGRRDVDVYLSKNLGGYRSNEDSTQTVYGNYVEPILHGVEHTARAVYGDNSQEWARAKDEFASVGNGGLRNMDSTYQDENRQGGQGDYDDDVGYGDHGSYGDQGDQGGYGDQGDQGGYGDQGDQGGYGDEDCSGDQYNDQGDGDYGDDDY